jgi:hypothetical protein
MHCLDYVGMLYTLQASGTCHFLGPLQALRVSAVPIHLAEATFADLCQAVEPTRGQSHLRGLHNRHTHACCTSSCCNCSAASTAAASHHLTLAQHPLVLCCWLMHGN